MAIGSSIITADGINALSNASASGTSVKPKYFKFSNKDLVLDPNLSASDINGWRTQDINLYQKVDSKTVEFVCDVIPTEASDYTRVCGLYLEDGTLFMVAKPPYPFPPSLRQTFKIQMVYENVSDLLDFKYLPFSETEQDLSLLNTNTQLGLFAYEAKEKIEKLKQRADAIYKLEVGDKNELESSIDRVESELKNEIERVENDTHLDVLNSNATLGNLIFKTREKIEKIKLT